ncbi:MAG: GatB/YqeY domain-containing protein [Gammaproteobacteria bacterium]|nr:GatB/YqeY domain-containing protein [Gammaproteobacteria bacterium]
MIQKADIQQELHQCMRSGDKAKVQALRLVLAAIKQVEVDERIEVDSNRLLAILSKMAKQRQESIEQYLKANRQDLVTQEQYELDLIQSYLPQPFSETEILNMIETSIQELNATSIRDMGKVMNVLRPQLTGRADLSKVSELIKQKLPN